MTEQENRMRSHLLQLRELMGELSAQLKLRLAKDVLNALHQSSAFSLQEQYEQAVAALRGQHISLDLPSNNRLQTTLEVIQQREDDDCSSNSQLQLRQPTREERVKKQDIQEIMYSCQQVISLMLHALLEAYRHVLALQWGRNWSISMDQQYLASLKKLANSKARKVNKESILQGIQALRNQLVQIKNAIEEAHRNTIDPLSQKRWPTTSELFLTNV